MPEAVVRVEGLARFRSTLKRAGADMADMKAANSRVAELVAREGSSRAPRRTGRLAGSLRPARRVSGARVTSSLAYAGVIEFGWPARGITAQPFLTDAARATQPQWIAMYEDDLQKIADSVKGA